MYYMHSAYPAMRSYQEDDEHIIGHNFQGEFDEALFHTLDTNDILDRVINPNNPHMEGGVTPAAAVIPSDPQ